MKSVTLKIMVLLMAALLVLPMLAACGVTIQSMFQIAV